MTRTARLIPFGVALTMVGFFAAIIWTVAAPCCHSHCASTSFFSEAVLYASVIGSPWLFAAYGLARGRAWARGFSFGLALLVVPMALLVLSFKGLSPLGLFGLAHVGVALLLAPSVTRAMGGDWRLSWWTTSLGFLAPLGAGVGLVTLQLQGWVSIPLALGVVGLGVAIAGAVRGRTWGLFGAALAALSVLTVGGIQALDVGARALSPAALVAAVVVFGLVPWVGPVARHLRGR